WCAFFFSSRRRHTRLVSDWSSDVCSSDLASVTGVRERSRLVTSLWAQRRNEPGPLSNPGHGRGAEGAEAPQGLTDVGPLAHSRQIGRASCRERAVVSGGGGAGT